MTSVSTRHLSSDAISKWFTKELSAAEIQHIAGCPLCGAKVARLEETLSVFRGVMRSWVNGQATSGLPLPERVSRRISLPFMPRRARRVIAVAMLVVLAAAIPIHDSARKRRLEAEAAQSAENAVLLDSIDRQLRRAVPAAMEPLFQLISTEADLVPNIGSTLGGAQIETRRNGDQ